MGKTEVSQALARKLDTEIIQADSRQVYRYMDIGTAKPPPALCRLVKRHLIDVVNPDEHFSAGRYRRLALPVLESLIAEGKPPVVEGGSGLYIRALVDGLFEGPAADKSYRKKLKSLAKERGVSYLYQELERVDPAGAERLHPNDCVRIIRALEVYHNTGKSISDWHTKAPPSSGFSFRMYGLSCPRPQLYERINCRVDEMLKEGLLKEVEGLLDLGYHSELNSMQGLGYKHMSAYLRGDCDMASAVSLMKRDTRRYAKRQLTWFRADNRICWLDFPAGMDAERVADKIYFELEQATGFVVSVTKTQLHIK